MTLSAGLLATLLGILFGILKTASSPALRLGLDTLTDAMRSVPLLVQVMILYSALNIVGLKLGVDRLAIMVLQAGTLLSVAEMQTDIRKSIEMIVPLGRIKGRRG